MRSDQRNGEASLDTSSHADANVWFGVWALLSRELLRSIWLIILFGIAGFALRIKVPAHYVAFAEFWFGKERDLNAEALFP